MFRKSEIHRLEIGVRAKHVLNGPGEVPTGLSLSKKLQILNEARGRRDSLLGSAQETLSQMNHDDSDEVAMETDIARDYVWRAKGFQWIVMSALYALGVHKIPKSRPDTKGRQGR